MNSNKNIKENAKEIIFFLISYTLSVAQLTFILMTLIINQWYLETQKTLVTLFISKKMKERFLIKTIS